MWRLFLYIVSGILGLWLADLILNKVQFIGPLPLLIVCGTILGIINFFIKPVLKTITLPLRIITLNLFSLLINMLLIWLVDIIFPELIILGIIGLFWTAIIVWLIEFFLLEWFGGRRRIKSRA